MDPPSSTPSNTVDTIPENEEGFTTRYRQRPDQTIPILH